MILRINICNQNLISKLIYVPTQPPFMQVGVAPVQEATLAEHLHTLFAASQYSPEVCPAQPAREEVHLQMPFPPLAEESQNDPVVKPAQDANEEVHLQILLAASQ